MVANRQIYHLHHCSISIHALAKVVNHQIYLSVHSISNHVPVHALVAMVNDLILLNALRQPLLSNLENWLIDEETHPDIADYLLTGLTSWFEDPFGSEPAIIFTIRARLEC
jgi:hypothetical protein